MSRPKLEGSYYDRNREKVKQRMRERYNNDFKSINVVPLVVNKKNDEDVEKFLHRARKAGKTYAQAQVEETWQMIREREKKNAKGPRSI